ncbi:MAG: alpha/beta hydrolase [Alphaproteobacteria bacterium]|nr:alpha/beta hydrolase [Alphaproteobacteria bacterium]
MPAHHVVPDGPVSGTALLLHGIGLGAWIWERDQALLAARGWESWAVTLPGHGADAGADVGLAEVLDAVNEAIAALGRPAIIGHSMGGLLAQCAAGRAPVHAAVLVASHPCGEVGMRPTPQGARSMLPRLPAFLAGRPLRFRLEDYLAAGLDQLEPERAAALFARITPWPNRLVRDLARPLKVGRLSCPVLVTHGLLDPLVSLRSARLLADHHDAILWRFDDLAHMPPLEPGGARHLQAVADWLARPRGRKVTEVDPLQPDEGVGADARAWRRVGGPRSNSRFRRR